MLIRYRRRVAALAAASVVAATGSALACSGENHTAPAQYVEVKVKNDTGEPLDVEIRKNGDTQTHQTIIAGKSVTWNLSMDPVELSYFSTAVEGRGTSEFSVQNDANDTKKGTIFKNVQDATGVKCSKDWGSTNKRWKVTYTAK